MIMEEILKLLEEHCRGSDHKSGLTTVQVWQGSGLPYTQVRTHLKQLHREGKIYFREGVNNTLFFSKPDNKLRIMNSEFGKTNYHENNKI